MTMTTRESAVAAVERIKEMMEKEKVGVSEYYDVFLYSKKIREFHENLVHKYIRKEVSKEERAQLCYMSKFFYFDIDNEKDRISTGEVSEETLESSMEIKSDWIDIFWMTPQIYYMKAEEWYDDELTDFWEHYFRRFPEDKDNVLA